MFSQSYYSLTCLKQLADGRNDPKSNLPPRSIGAVASPLMRKILGGHHGVALPPHDVDMIRSWIESGAPYPGTYGALGSGMIGGYYANNQVGTDFDWPSTIRHTGLPATATLPSRDGSVPGAEGDANARSSG